MFKNFYFGFDKGKNYWIKNKSYLKNKYIYTSIYSDSVNAKKKIHNQLAFQFEATNARQQRQSWGCCSCIALAAPVLPAPKMHIQRSAAVLAPQNIKAARRWVAQLFRMNVHKRKRTRWLWRRLLFAWMRQRTIVSGWFYFVCDILFASRSRGEGHWSGCKSQVSHIIEYWIKQQQINQPSQSYMSYAFCYNGALMIVWLRRSKCV